jgi:ABC-type multidrug transport system fused ATPase/permease subunit
MDKSKVQPFRRIFKYVWPQWPRLIVIFFTAMLGAVLFSLSFATVMPLLKVMMGEEGLHSWIDRRSCNWKYGMDFYVPDRADFVDPNNQEILCYLIVTSVDDDGQAHIAGISPQDKIVGAGSFMATKNTPIHSAKLLEELATTADGSLIDVQLRSINEAGKTVPGVVQLETLPKPDDMDPKQVSFIRRFQWGAKWMVMQRAQWAVGFLPRENAKTNKRKAIIFIILLMAGVTTARCIATFYQKYLAEKVVQVAIAHLRENVFSHVMMMPVGYFSSKGTSDTISRLLGDTSGTGKGVKILLGKALREPQKAFWCLVIAFTISWQLTLIFLCAAPITIGLLGLLGRKIKKATRRSLMTSARMLGKVQDTIKSLRVVKVYNRQKYEIGLFGDINKKFLRHSLRIAKVQAATGPTMEFLGMVAGSAALLVGAYWVCSPGIEYKMEPSQFFGILLLLGTAAESVRKSSDVWNKVQEANAAAERVYAIVDAPLEAEQPGAIELPPLKEQIEFRDVVFTYPDADEPVLKGINLKVQAGETVAVVGPNGSGKTTLVNLIPRFYDVDNGMILIDGQDIYGTTLASLRDQIAMVTQNVVTFNETIAANISYGREDAGIEEIIGAAKCSFAHEFIDSEPDGYETLIGEHGSGFSGGQLQRIVIARAALKNPSILIFDEAMSQIDADSESKIQQALSELMVGRTCFIIAHRFSTIISADRIVVMDEGRIVAQGRHEELIKSCGLYQNLYETQLMAPQ